MLWIMARTSAPIGAKVDGSEGADAANSNHRRGSRAELSYRREEGRGRKYEATLIFSDIATGSN